MGHSEPPQVFEQIKDDLALVEQGLKDYLKTHTDIIPEVGEYIFLSGGKRFRPSLLLLSCKLGGYEGCQHIPLACTVEFLHTATLLHDDVVDGAGMRRGRASVNSIWGNQASVLIGDFFLARSLSLLVANGDQRILELFCHTTEKMAQGEVMQLIQAGEAGTKESEYLEVVENKTASLVSTACQAGAILAGLSGREEQFLASYGHNLGIAFQLVDDALDYVILNEKFGKEAGTDLREGKVTLPLIHFLAEAPAKEADRVRKLLTNGRVARAEVINVISRLVEFGSVQYVLSRAREFSEQAKAEINHFPPGRWRSALAGIADYVVEREV
ncbi:MAG: polyprenyl synthetase family protein [Thermodesulfobacteriota bacterium]